MNAVRMAALAALLASALFVPTGILGADEDRAAAAAERVRPELEKALEKKGLAFGAPIFIRIFKESDELEVWVQKEPEAAERGEPEQPPSFELFRSYEICKWSGSTMCSGSYCSCRLPTAVTAITQRTSSERSAHRLAR